VTLDPTRTSLSGHAGSVRLTRTSNHELVFQTGVAWRSPGFEINDLGFMRAADGINQFTWVAYQKRNPFGVFNSLNVNGNQWLEWDYGGNFLGSQWNVNSNAQFRNRYGAGFGVTRTEERISNTELRGGPSSRWSGDWSGNFWVETDGSRKLSAGLGGFVRRGDDGSEDTWERWVSLTWRPSDAVRLSLNPSQSRSEREMQYVATTGFGAAGSGAAGSGAADRFVFGRLEQETTVITVRLDYSITPDLTVQLYASPFVSTGRFDVFKRITDPRAGAFRDRFDVYGSEEIAYDATADRFDVDENGDGVVDYGFSNPDFDFRELNTNLVIRWEYRPGSTIFLVWSQVRDDASLLDGDLDYRGNLDQLFSAPAHDVVLVKVSKWFSL
jgi:hypothetical protein